MTAHLFLCHAAPTQGRRQQQRAVEVHRVPTAVGYYPSYADNLVCHTRSLPASGIVFRCPAASPINAAGSGIAPIAGSSLLRREFNGPTSAGSPGAMG